MSKDFNAPGLEPVSQREVEAIDAVPRAGGAPRERGEDLLERYIRVPNRMMLLYSSEDEALSQYIVGNWAALDSMSNEICDIYPSLLQLSGGEDVYSFINNLHYVPGAQTVRIDKLPIILLWSDNAYLSISLSDVANDLPSIRKVIRGIFQCLYDIRRGITVQDEVAFKAILEPAYTRTDGKGVSYLTLIDQRVTMTKNEYNAGRGGVVLGDGAMARDITISQGSCRVPG
jgi:hypothetical protein